MDLEKQIVEKAEKNIKKLEFIKTWPEKVNSLRNKESGSVSEAVFCCRYKIHQATFNRCKNLTATSMPSDKFFSAVKLGFENEGV